MFGKYLSEKRLSLNEYIQSENITNYIALVYDSNSKFKILFILNSNCGVNFSCLNVYRCIDVSTSKRTHHASSIEYV